MYPSLNANVSNDQQFRLNKINEIKNHFITDNKERELMKKRHSKDIASFDYFDKSLIVLLVATGIIFMASFTTVIGAPVGIMSASCSLKFSVTTGFLKKILKTIRNKNKKHNKVVMLFRSKLKSMESKISAALINNAISHEDFMTWRLNEEKKYRELKKSISMMNNQWSDVAKIILIEEGKKGVNEVMKLLISI